jgi:O-antigen ligase
MKKVFYIKDNIENKISYYHLLLFMLLLPFDRIYSTLVLLSFTGHSLICFRKKKLQHIDRTVLVLQLVFLITVASLLYAVYPLRGLDTAGKQLAIFLFPLVLATTSLNLRKYSSNLFLGFSLGCSATILYLYLDAFHIILYNHLPVKMLFSPAFVNHNFALSIEMHATYLSMLLVLSLTWLLQQLFTQPREKLTPLYIICAVILMAGLVQLGSKSALCSFIIVIIAGFPWLVLTGKKRAWFLCASIALLMLLSVVILSVDVFRNRYVTMLKNDLHENTGLADKSGRLDRWNAAVHLIKENPVLGTGAGSEIPLLKDLYFQRKMYAAWLHSLNVHNQYLGLLINTGMFGLLVYLSTISWALRRAIKKRDILLFAFIILIAVVSCAEDILDVNKGIFFYAFFLSLLVLSKRNTTAKYISRERQPSAALNEYIIIENIDLIADN